MPFRTFNGNPTPRVIVHATTNPTADNFCPIGTIWINVTTPALLVCSQITSGQSTWIAIT